MKIKTTEQNINKEISSSHEIKIGGITYTVVSHFSDISNETVEKKIERLIKKDIKG